MRDHGATSIVPINKFLLVLCPLLSAFILPWWLSVILTVVSFTLWRVAEDQYCGMQVCLLILPGVLFGILVAGKKVTNKLSDSQEVYSILHSFLVPAVVIPTLLIVFLSLLGSMFLLWDSTASGYLQSDRSDASKAKPLKDERNGSED